ncbi:hypothetical protein [Streptomyces sp. NPDC057695]
MTAATPARGQDGVDGLIGPGTVVSTRAVTVRAFVDDVEVVP